jgi:hypothetical protein
MPDNGYFGWFSNFAPSYGKISALFSDFCQKSGANSGFLFLVILTERLL